MSTNERMSNKAPRLRTTIWITSSAGYRYRSMEDRQAGAGFRESELWLFNISSQHDLGPSDAACVRFLSLVFLRKSDIVAQFVSLTTSSVG